ncbi:MAG: hypothetical protein Kow0090_12890 [Myxococcota bacterium]
MCCGNGICESSYKENCLTCPADCSCGKGEICAGSGVCVEECEPQCFGKECGEDGCGGNCGICPADKPTCNKGGGCEGGECQPNCAGKECGTDGCGGVCGYCSGNEECSVAGKCTSEVCSEDCGKLWSATCATDGYGYRICGVDEANPECAKESIRISCEEGRSCSSGKCSGKCLVPEIIFVVDRSSSMTESRWRFMTEGLLEFVKGYQGRAEMGLRMFPSGDGCYASSVVSVQKNNYQNIQYTLLSSPPSTSASTPISASLADLKPYFGDPDEGQYAILLTDGGESCEDEFAPVEVVKILRSQGIKTFVVGISTQANADLLAAMVDAAGTALPGAQKFPLVETKAALVAALKDIFNTMEACQCFADEKVCTEGKEYKVCSSDGSKWATTEQCKYACDAQFGCWGECDPNESGGDSSYKCDGDALMYCDYNYAWQLWDNCYNGCDPVKKQCYSQCRPNSTYCNYDYDTSKYSEFKCKSDGTGYAVSKVCASGCSPMGDVCNEDVTEICNPSTDYKCVTISSGCYYSGYYCSVKCKSDGSGFPTGTCSNDYYGCDGGTVCNFGSYTCSASTKKCY